MIRPPTISTRTYTLFPYTTLSRSRSLHSWAVRQGAPSAPRVFQWPFGEAPETRSLPARLPAIRKWTCMAQAYWRRQPALPPQAGGLGGAPHPHRRTMCRQGRDHSFPDIIKPVAGYNHCRDQQRANSLVRYRDPERDARHQSENPQQDLKRDDCQHRVRLTLAPGPLRPQRQNQERGRDDPGQPAVPELDRSEENTSELQSLLRISYAVS